MSRARSRSTPTEIELRVSRSSGPGGQHANKAETRVEAVFDVEASASLSAAQKRRVVARAGPVLRAVAQDERSQARNRELAVERLVAKLAEALRVERRRVATRPTRASGERRLAEKRRRARRQAHTRRSRTTSSGSVTRTRAPHPGSRSSRCSAVASAGRTSGVRRCPSTQDVLRDTDLPEGAVAVTEHQTAGRGRDGRPWEDVARDGAPPLAPAAAAGRGRRAAALALVCGLAVAEAVEATTGDAARVKWPNDVLLDGRKVAGSSARGATRAPSSAGSASTSPRARASCPATRGAPRRRSAASPGASSRSRGAARPRCSSSSSTATTSGSRAGSLRCCTELESAQRAPWPRGPCWRARGDGGTDRRGRPTVADASRRDDGARRERRGDRGRVVLRAARARSRSAPSRRDSRA